MRQEIDEAIKRVLDSGYFILNKEVAAFEKAFAEFCNTTHAIGVANGTEALYIALRVLYIGPGDEVITVSHTAPATICAIKMTGATPVYVDIKENSLLMNPDLIIRAVTRKTKVIMPVHLYGRVCDMERIKEIADRLDCSIIEDCAQSVGAGSLRGDIGCYSFYPTKNLGGIGDGGAIVTNIATLAYRMKRLREYGYGARFVSEFMGINSRLDEIQAAVLGIKLKYLHEETERRIRLAAFYTTELKDMDLILPEMVGVFHQYVVRSKRRDELVKALNAQVHYPMPCHLQPAYKSPVKLPVTEKISKEILSLPMRVSIEEAKEICDKIKEEV